MYKFKKTTTIQKETEQRSKKFVIIMRVGLKSLRERVHAHVSKHSDLRGRTEPDMTEVT